MAASRFAAKSSCPRAAPPGGDGGIGGSVYCLVDRQLTTLLDISSRPEWKAEDGEGGMGENSATAATGKDLVIHVPPGTVIYDDERGRGPERPHRTGPKNPRRRGRPRRPRQHAVQKGHQPGRPATPNRAANRRSATCGWN